MDRPLSAEEERLLRWMLENGEPSAVDYLPQVARVRVAAVCPCGCASLDFSVDGAMAAPGKIRVLGDYVIGAPGSPCGAFVFERGGTLAGLEIYAVQGPAPATLPGIEELRRYDER